MDVVTISTILQGLGALVAVVGVFWGLVMAPQKRHNAQVDSQLKDHESRLRSVEHVQISHDKQIENMAKSIDKLVEELREFNREQREFYKSQA